MALSSTIYKVDLQVSNMDSHYYEEHKLTIAKHPSETEERMMVRILAFALYAQEELCFGKGVSNEEEPALWLKDRTGTIDLWIDVGQPEERRIRKACGRAKQVVVLSYGAHNAERWWVQNQDKLSNIHNLTIMQLKSPISKELATIADRNMNLICNIEEGQIYFISGDTTLTIEPVILLSQ